MQSERTAESAATVLYPLAPRLRKCLHEIAGQAIPITYQAIAKLRSCCRPQTIQKVTNALERLLAEDAAIGHRAPSFHNIDPPSPPNFTL